MSASDDELLELGEELAALVGELSSAREGIHETGELFDDEVERAHNRPEDYNETCFRVSTETEVGQAYVRACRATDAIYDRLFPLCYRIKAFQPQTTKGRAVKRWASAFLSQHRCFAAYIRPGATRLSSGARPRGRLAGKRARD